MLPTITSCFQSYEKLKDIESSSFAEVQISVQTILGSSPVAAVC